MSPSCNVEGEEFTKIQEVMEYFMFSHHGESGFSGVVSTI